MSWEEKMCGPHLPPNVCAVLKQEHQRIIAGGLQRADLERHSQWEEAIFRRYVPPNIVAKVIADHAAYESGRLRSRISR